MQEIYVEPIAKVIQNKRLLEKGLKVKIKTRGKNVFLNGSAENEFIAVEVMKALDLEFSVPNALLLKKEDTILQEVHIKKVTRRRNLEEVRARIIGTKGKALSTVHNLTECNISLKDNTIGIIGNAEEIKNTIQAITSIIQGSKHGNVYSRLEKEKKKKRFYGKLNIKHE